MAKMFGPDMWGKIAGNPKLSQYLAMPDVVGKTIPFLLTLAKLQRLERDPSAINEFMSDQRMMAIMMGLMGLDGNFTGPDSMDTSEENIEEVDGDANPTKTPRSTPSYQESPAMKPQREEPRARAPVPVVLSEEQIARAESDKQKDLGNIEYKARNFDRAIELYNIAFEIDSTNLSVLTNKSAVLFEKQAFKECIEVCEKAIEIGQEIYADFKLLAR